jgi:dipeptidase D
MAALEQLEPKEVFTFFEKLCSIPHGSGNLQKISDYLVSFARERDLEVIQDKELNVIIKAPGSKGYEDKEPVILQGHMDMVAVKDGDCDIDMTSEGLRVTTDGENVWAEGTSLGGDDGIAVAYCLALLDSDTIPHPPLEVVITTNEETGMFGAAAIDLSMLKGKKMINIDNEEEGVFITSCAGGARVYSKLPMKKEKNRGALCVVDVAGLLGGHSGEMIKCGRGNAIRLLARTLRGICKEMDVSLLEVNGGVADNAIPSSATAQIFVPEGSVDKAAAIVAEIDEAVRGELKGKDNDVKISFAKKESLEAESFTAADTAKLMDYILVLPDGVQGMSAFIDGLVETSLNLGIIKSDGEAVTIDHSVRSSVATAKKELIEKLLVIDEMFGAEAKVSGEYPGWEYKAESALRDHMVKVYEEMYGHKPKLEAIHAGLECGILSEKIEGLDCISIGPDMQAIHSAQEKLSVSSTKNVWEYLKAVLESWN